MKPTVAIIADKGIIGGSNTFVVLLYTGFLIYIAFCYYGGISQLYAWTVSRDTNPVLYWSWMGLMTVLAIVFGYFLIKNLF